MSITAILILIIIGIILLLIEMFIIPGFTFAGIAGIVCMIAGIFFAYKSIGIKEGNIILLITFLLNIVLLVYSLRTKTWKRIGLKAEIDGKVNLLEMDLKIGDIGKSVSKLALSGKALFNEKLIEVYSDEGYIDSNQEIVITHIKDNKIFIKTKKK